MWDVLELRWKLDICLHLVVDLEKTPTEVVIS